MRAVLSLLDSTQVPSDILGHHITFYEKFFLSRDLNDDSDSSIKRSVRMFCCRSLERQMNLPSLLSALLIYSHSIRAQTKTRHTNNL